MFLLHRGQFSSKVSYSCSLIRLQRQAYRQLGEEIVGMSESPTPPENNILHYFFPAFGHTQGEGTL